MAMKLTSALSFLSIVILVLATSSPAPLNAAPQDQGQSLTSPNIPAPQLWNELRLYETLDVQQSADEQLEYYYNRVR
jgi:hypothetical protein